MKTLFPLLYFAFHDFTVTAFPQDPNGINTGSLGDFLVSYADLIDKSQSDSATGSDSPTPPVIQNSGFTVPIDFTSKSLVPQIDPNNPVYTGSDPQASVEDTGSSNDPVDTTPHDDYPYSFKTALDPANTVPANPTTADQNDPRIPEKPRIPNNCNNGKMFACCSLSLENGYKFCVFWWYQLCLTIDDWACCSWAKDGSKWMTDCEAVKWPPVRKKEPAPVGNFLDGVPPTVWRTLEQTGKMLEYVKEEKGGDPPSDDQNLEREKTPP